MVRFAIVGAGGHGRVIADIILACGGEIAFVVDDSPQGKILANKNAISPKEFLMLGLQKEIKITLGIVKQEEPFLKFLNSRVLRFQALFIQVQLFLKVLK